MKYKDILGYSEPEKKLIKEKVEKPTITEELIKTYGPLTESHNYEKLRKNFEKTYKAYWDAVNDFQLALKKQGKKKEEMMIHRKYSKEVLGFHAWMRQWIRKVFF